MAGPMNRHPQFLYPPLNCANALAEELGDVFPAREQLLTGVRG